MTRTGRPTRLTKELADEVCKYVSAGNYRIVAAQAAGVSNRAMSEWIAKGKREKSGQHADFLRKLLEAESIAERAMLNVVLLAAKTDWKAAAWFLERKAADRWGRKDKTILKQSHVAPVGIGGDTSPERLTGARRQA